MFNKSKYLPSPQKTLHSTENINPGVSYINTTNPKSQPDLQFPTLSQYYKSTSTMIHRNRTKRQPSQSKRR